MNNKKIVIIIIAFFLIGFGIISFFVFGKSERKIFLEQSPEEKIVDLENVQIESPVVKEENPSQKTEESENLDEQKEERIEVKSEEKIEEKKEAPTSLEVKNNLVSFGFSASSGRKIDTVIIHSSYNSLGGDEYDVEKIIGIYKDYGVAAHYIIGRDGEILKLVEEKNIAYHAGVSEVPDGRKNVNDFSIGIEMVGNKTDGYTQKQYEAVSKLVDDIKERYSIKYVLGHKDIAPTRKDDPWKFDFSKLK